jgi:hypothetical protein
MTERERLAGMAVEYIERLNFGDDHALNVRAYNALKRDDVNTVKQLEAKVICELRDYRNVGIRTVKVILIALKTYNGHELTCDHDDQSCIKWLNSEKGN